LELIHWSFFAFHVSQLSLTLSRVLARLLTKLIGRKEFKHLKEGFILLANHGDFADLPRLRKESEEKT
jgi:hypothetical protein